MNFWNYLFHHRNYKINIMEENYLPSRSMESITVYVESAIETGDLGMTPINLKDIVFHLRNNMKINKGMSDEMLASIKVREDLRAEIEAKTKMLNELGGSLESAAQTQRGMQVTIDQLEKDYADLRQDRDVSEHALKLSIRTIIEAIK